jgi:hypothetical protein
VKATGIKTIPATLADVVADIDRVLEGVSKMANLTRAAEKAKK